MSASPTPLLSRYLKGSLPIWQAIASFPQIWIGSKDFSILNLAQYASDFEET